MSGKALLGNPKKRSSSKTRPQAAGVEAGYGDDDVAALLSEGWYGQYAAVAAVFQAVAVQVVCYGLAAPAAPASAAVACHLCWRRRAS
eukprot:CAMPEP_0175115376 /NCGR_PEP_ID=MMETSP0086_2-20121207/17525_1 /TAXON_ID=136419 /ORGANISM="Unknown Unknown, Strain D1" /LENGTH=87 /DNA_ID=CAMNT_0016395425 /DNA_START=39 /DNA_END=299 /DNA_ORIENTATION=+